ncbi:MAG: type I restriction endonuclease [Syntrophobacteraceae bacterium]
MVTRQLRCSRDETLRALDLVLFINGLPVATFELRNRLIKQTVDALAVRYLEGADREKLDPLLEACMAACLDLHEDGQVDFKRKAKAFVAIQSGMKTTPRKPEVQTPAQTTVADFPI